MKRIDKIFDKLMFVIGVILLIMFWVQFPPLPDSDKQLYTYYTSEAETTSSSKWTYLKPDKQLTPREVVRIQLQALQQNDGSDSGIITVFNFSSPRNKMYLGPIDHFRLLVREPPYRPMLNFKSYKAGQLVVVDDTAYQLVVVQGRDGQESAYLFILAKQKRGAHKGCWMTEGVARMEPERESKLI
ncbi:DUF4864 domain-containing protein [Pontibacter silvestris]|uniref:DUF4864 domain-containing protein n=1 Tax=Pontibacter silvestris TaxID=2305183 RepID=A0ABW4WWT0_9BACT|nr:DUF4864 domain-containing protein [Pontibacter silvestris]MCC9136857.1 DUF4864 domain-containing protein [Pontibacter silvestris]